MAEFISTCPSCRHALDVTELSCPHCHIQIRGRFQGHPSLTMTEEQLSFLRLFVLSRGNLREIERVLGISYPTVRNKLDDLVEAFQHTPGPVPSPSSPANRRSLLEDVAAGRVQVKDALALLSQRPKEESSDDGNS